MSLLTDASLIVTPNAYKEGKLYSVVPSDGSGDFSVTRATTATRVNAAGLVELVPYNLLTWSQDFTNAAWDKTITNVSATSIVDPQGYQNANSIVPNTTSGFHFVHQSVNASNLQSYTYSIYVKANGYNFLLLNTPSGTSQGNVGPLFNIQNGTLIGSFGGIDYSAQIISAGNNWYRINITLVSDGTPLIVHLNVFPTSSIAPYSGNGTSGVLYFGAQVNEGSLKDYQATETRLNIPRLDYSLGTCPSILVEPQRTNLFSYSNDFSSSAWQKDPGIVITPNSTISPDGTQNASLMDYQSSSVSMYRNLLTIGQTYTLSGYFKAFPGFEGKKVGLKIGGYDDLEVTLTNTWQRFSITKVAIQTDIEIFNRVEFEPVKFYLYGMQIEEGAYETSYIPTTSASVTRNADIINQSNIFTNGLVTASGGTWFVELRNNIPRIRDTFSSIRLIKTIAPFEGLLIGTSSSNARAIIVKNIAGTFTTLYTTTTDTTKIAIKWNGTTADIFANGTKVVSATSLPFLDLNELGNGVNMIATINSMALFPTPLTDGECSMLTSGIYTPALAYAQLGLVSESPACLDSSVNALL